MTKQDYMDMSGIVYHCDDCKHNDKQWYELPCDFCCPAHSGYEPVPSYDSTEEYQFERTVDELSKESEA